jgi:hypothetical protein
VPTCYRPQNGFSLAPATVEARWQRLQRARRSNPDASDPLFRAIDADDGQADFTLLRTRALFKVRVALPGGEALSVVLFAHQHRSRIAAPLIPDEDIAPIAAYMRKAF